MGKHWSFKWILVSLLLVVVALGLVASGRFTAGAVRAASLHANVTYVCTPFDVGVFNTRVHVRCTVPYSGTISWFAYPSSDSAGASRFLSLFETAKATGTTLTLYFDNTDLSGSTFGCGTSDCRRIWGATAP